MWSRFRLKQRKQQRWSEAEATRAWLHLPSLRIHSVALTDHRLSVQRVPKYKYMSILAFHPLRNILVATARIVTVTLSSAVQSHSHWPTMESSTLQTCTAVSCPHCSELKQRTPESCAATKTAHIWWSFRQHLFYFLTSTTYTGTSSVMAQTMQVLSSDILKCLKTQAFAKSFGTFLAVPKPDP